MAVIFVTLYSCCCHVCILCIHAFAELLFEPDLSNHDRATFYSCCRHLCILWIHAFAELLFEAGLSNADRAAVHVASRRLGMKSKSSGYVLGHLYLNVV